MSNSTKNPHAVALGRKGGLAKARLPKERLSELNRHAINERWRKVREKKLAETLKVN